MKIGILTFHTGFNYGAFFQVYALQKAIIALGYDCYIINYKDIGHTYKEYKSALLTKDPFELYSRLARILKYKQAQRRLRMTRRLFATSRTPFKQFDVIVYGADEIWNLNNSLFGVDDVYFGDGFDTLKRISYAASFGGYKTGAGGLPKKYVDYLRRFSSISLRDDNSLLIVKNNVTENAELVPDPTFLYDILKDKKIPPGLCGRDYIVVYATDVGNALRDEIVSFARDRNIDIVALGYKKQWADRSVIDLEPFEFLGAISGARFVCTNMFHGTIFSILSGRQFCLALTEYRKNKFFPMIVKLGVSERVYNNNLLSMFKNPIDYAKVESAVKIYSEMGIDFLSEALCS